MITSLVVTSILVCLLIFGSYYLSTGDFALSAKVFQITKRDRGLAARIRRLADGGSEEATSAQPAVSPAPAPPAPPAARHDALSLLAVLQREARLLDFLKEPIEGYSDAQIGAAVRSVHKDSAAVIDRMFGVQPLQPGAEGGPVEVPAGYDPARYRLVGNVPGQGPLRGKLAHPGWQATRSDVPEWTGRADAAQVITPAEVEF